MLLKTGSRITEWGLCEYVIVHTILGGSPVILWISLGGKPKWLPLKFIHDVMRTSPSHLFFSMFQIMVSGQCPATPMPQNLLVVYVLFCVPAKDGDCLCSCNRPQVNCACAMANVWIHQPQCLKITGRLSSLASGEKKIGDWKLEASYPNIQKILRSFPP